HAAARRRDPDRSAAVIGMRTGYDAAGDCAGRSARRATWGMGQPPRVASGAVQQRLRAGVLAELGSIGLADDYQPGTPIARRQYPVTFGDRVGEQATAIRGRQPRDVTHHVLNREGNPP